MSYFLYLIQRRTLILGRGIISHRFANFATYPTDWIPTPHDPLNLYLPVNSISISPDSSKTLNPLATSPQNSGGTLLLILTYASNSTRQAVPTTSFSPPYSQIKMIIITLSPTSASVCMKWGKWNRKDRWQLSHEPSTYLKITSVEEEIQRGF